MSRLLTLSKLFLLFLAIFFTSSVQAQDFQFHMSDNESGGGDSIQVDILLEDFDSIYSFQYTTRWDTSELTFLGVGNFNIPEMDENSFGYVGVDDGFLITLWADLNVVGYEVEDSTVIYSLYFTADCGGGGVDTAEVWFSGMPRAILATTLDSEFVPGTEDGSVIFVELDASPFTVVDANCNDGSDGCITINPEGGTPPFEYAWSNGGTGQELCGLAAGFYTCTVTDAGDCTSVSSSIEVDEPSALDVCSTSVTDADCAGDASGCIDINACGGTAPYTFLWSPGGETVEDICGLLAGAYSCIITDANDCTTTTGTINVGEPGAMSLINFNIVNATCTQGGSIDITINGGDDPYTYLWSNGDVTENIDDLLAGFYTCVVTDDSDCTFTTMAFEVVLENSDLAVTGSTVMNVSCFEGSDGSIELDVSGTGTPFNYVWSNGDMTQDIDGLDVDTYTCTITDSDGCVLVTQTFEITEPSTALVMNGFDITDLNCFEGDDGCVVIDVMGGNPPYSYLWSNGGTTEEVCSLPAGDFTCTITDAGGCTLVSGTATVNQPDLLEVCGSSVSDVSCFGGDDACISLTTCGGAGPYTYLWSNGMDVEDICGIEAGMFSCTITDQNGCTAVIEDVIVVEPNEINIADVIIVNATCAQGGSVNITVAGGSDPYTYLWDNGDVTEDIDNLLAGFYTCIVTDDSDCTFTTMAFEVVLENSDLTLTGSTVMNVSCFDGNDGAIDLDVSGTGTPFDYDWSNGDVTQDIDGLDTGTFTCTITDNDGCVLVTQTFELTEPNTALVVDGFDVIDLNCFGDNDGCVTINMMGGIPPYSYLWSNGETTQEVCGLPAGDFICTVTDAEDCSLISGTATVSQPDLLEICGNSVSDVTCFGGDDACIDLTICGGVGPYTYLWSNSATDEDICGLIFGMYSCTVTDVNNCTVILEGIVVDEPEETTIANVMIVNATCSQGGSIDITVAGANNPYTYLWNNGAVTEDIDDLIAGFYSCEITDNSNCTFTTISFEVELENSDLAFENSVEVAVSCFGGDNGMINLNLSGSATPFTYLWSNGEMTEDISGLVADTYTCTITDANGCVITTPSIIVSQPDGPLEVDAVVVTDVSCFGESDGMIALTMVGGSPQYMYDWSNGGTTVTIDNLPPGTYSCTITDVNDCMVETAAFEIVQPTAIGLTASQTVDANCSGGGSVSISVDGGNNPYTYLWSNGAMTEDITNVLAGIYNCTITDNSMCTFVTQTFTVEEDEGDLVLENITSTNVNCIGGSDGSITLTVSGSATPITYLWDTGEMDQNLTSLSPGIYTCTITDGNTCSVVTQSVTISEPTSGVSVDNLAGEDASCSDSNNGSISLSLSGGTLPYSYLWSNGEVTEDLDGLAPNDYSCIVTDGNDCVITTATVTIAAPDPLLINLVSSADASCGQGGSNGSIDIDVDGGTPIYSYLWSNGEMMQDIDGIPSGSYTCTVTDLQGCTQVSEVFVIENIGSNLMYNGAMTSNVNCFGDGNGFIDIDVTGIATPLTYSWSNSAMTEDLDALTGGEYSCTITNANGCTTVTPVFTITEPEMALGVNMVITTFTCAGTANGSILIDGIGGTAPYDYVWSNGGMTDEITDLPAGDYVCTITDANGCDFTTNVIVIENIDSDLEVTGEVVGQINCFGFDDGFVNLDVTGSAAPLMFNWSNAAVTEDIDNLPAGDYSCTITDGNGCTVVTNTFTIDESPEALTVSLVSLTDASCDQGLGSIDIDVVGGLAMYNYAWSNTAVTQDLVGISAGIYNCTITDMNGCTLVTPDYDVLNDGSDLALNGTSKGDVNCFGESNGFINIDVSGTATPITFAWSNGAMTQNLSGLMAGTFSCTITDNSGCTAITPIIEILEPEAALTSETAQFSNACTGADNGSITIEVSGGTPSYSYAWSNGGIAETISDLPAGIYTCVVTDAQGCEIETETYEVLSVDSDLTVNSSIVVGVTCFGDGDGSIDIEPTGTATPFTYLWSNGLVSQDLDALFPGTYSCVITDANGCVFETEEYVVGTPDLLEACMVNVQQPLCDGVADGCIDLMACGGTAPFTYLWSNGETLANICGLEEGIYNCTITDANNCTSVSPAYELESTATPMTLDASSVSNAACGQGGGGSVDITIGGGISPYTYLWNNGEVTEDLVGAIAGTYTCIVTDNQGCTFVTTSFQIENDGSDLMLTAITDTDILCAGASTGVIDISVNGSEEPFLFEWSNGEETEDLEDLMAGTYSCTVTDNVGCSIVVLEVEITEPESMVEVDQLVGDDPDCFEGEDGSIILDVSGGTMPYTFLWNDNSMDEDRDGLGAGDYICTITDGNGCELVTEMISIVEPAAITLSSSVIMNEIGGMSNGSVAIEVTGGTAPYTYLWDDASMSTNDTLSGVPAGDYSCIVTDANDCTAELGVFTVEETDGVNDLENPGFEVYPNPFVEQFTIVLEAQALDIQIVDVAGRVLYQDADPGIELTQEIEVYLPAGVYVLKIQMDDGQMGLKKLVVR